MVGPRSASPVKRSEAVWLWESELRELGFKRKSERYWQCERRFGLDDCSHLSIYSWREQTVRGARSGPVRFLVELTEFHVTFERERDNIHFYFHERLENEWEPGGHTSSVEIRQLGYEPAELREVAEEIAVTFIEAVNGVYHPRGC
jgi:hypothetical protein